MPPVPTFRDIRDTRPHFTTITHIALALLVGLALACSGAEVRRASFSNSPRLEEILRARLDGDRTGACFAAAVVERGGVERAYVCADPKEDGRIGPETAFEIGSIAKTMTAALLADLILQGKASLDEPLEDLLPQGVRVPRFDELPILLRHVVTHTSGLPRLPPAMEIRDPSDPYASLDVETLLGSLEGLELSRAPGAEYEYSNYATMILSHAIARRAGVPFETLIQDRLFTPLGMKGTHLGAPPPGVRAAQGHDPNGREVPAWNIAPELSGVGGVRATLDDMVAYVEAHLGMVDAPIVEALRHTHAAVKETPPRLAMNWLLARISRGEILAHEGGTGGFSSLIAIDPRAERGVIVLSDTSVPSLGDVGIHLMDPGFPLGKPRK